MQREERDKVQSVFTCRLFISMLFIVFITYIVFLNRLRVCKGAILCLHNLRTLAFWGSPVERNCFQVWHWYCFSYNFGYLLFGFLTLWSNRAHFTHIHFIDNIPIGTVSG